jgi:hypothetical protein
VATSVKVRFGTNVSIAGVKAEGSPFFSRRVRSVPGIKTPLRLNLYRISYSKRSAFTDTCTSTSAIESIFINVPGVAGGTVKEIIAVVPRLQVLIIKGVVIYVPKYPPTPVAPVTPVSGAIKRATSSTNILAVPA